MNIWTTGRDLICRWLHRQGPLYNRDGKTYQRCLGWPLSRRGRMRGELSLGCGREFLSKVQVPGRAPFRPYTESEMTGIEKVAREGRWIREQEIDVVGELERTRGKR